MMAIGKRIASSGLSLEEINKQNDAYLDKAIKSLDSADKLCKEASSNFHSRNKKGDYDTGRMRKISYLAESIYSSINALR